MTVFALVVFSALLSFGSSQPPPPTPSESAYTDQNKTAPKEAEADTNKQSSDPSASAFDKQRPTVAPRDQQQARSERQQSSPVDWWSRGSTILITLFTGALALLAFLQWSAMHKQAQYMRDALVETRKAADAAKLSANISRLGLEAGIGINMVLVTDCIFQEDDDTLTRCRVEITATNTGNSSARAFCFEYTIFIEGLTDDFVIKPDPIRIATGDLAPSHQIVRRSPMISELFPNSKRIGWSYVIDGKNLTVVGSVHYQSVFGERLRIDYVARPDPSTIDRQPDRLLVFEVVGTLKSDTEA